MTAPLAPPPSRTRPRVVIVGGGFGGLSAALSLKRAPVRITLVDRTNHHVFQPLLYQVAIAMLSPGEVAAPIRQILARQENAEVMMAEVAGLDLDTRRLRLADSPIPLDYDFLVLATGAAPSYFGHDEFEGWAPSLKSIADATAVRARILAAFENAERTRDPAQRGRLLTFVLVGAGPTGVEMAGAIAELRRFTLPHEFRHIDPRTARVLLLDAGSRVLPSFSEVLSRKVHDRLQRMGVEVRVGARVERVDQEGVIVNGEPIASSTVIWTAGVKPSPVAQWLGAPTDAAGRVRVERDLTVPRHHEVFVIGDAAALVQDGRPLPGVAQVAIQTGRHAARVIAARVAGRPAPGPFRYRDLGNLAVIGRNYAILESGRVRLAGFVAWIIWAAIHINNLTLFSDRLLVLVQWAWTYLTRQHGARLIVRPAGGAGPPTAPPT